MKKTRNLPLNENDGPRLVRPNKPTCLTIAPDFERLFVKSDAWKQIVRRWQSVGRPPTGEGGIGRWGLSGGRGEASEAAPTHDQEVEVLLLEEKKV